MTRASMARALTATWIVLLTLAACDVPMEEDAGLAARDGAAVPCAEREAGCAPPSCSDGARNHGESDIDCG
ncbi:MAG: hypothetical protein EXR72_13870 [Myxococcales bacterium]|nr:hypothetical protein [Myxococcales bacterium]